MKYFGPSCSSSLKLLRSIAYFTSLELTSVPSWNFTPLRILKVQVLPPSGEVPICSARSGTTLRLSVPAVGMNVVSEREYSRSKFWTQA